VTVSDGGHRGNSAQYSAFQAIDGNYDTYFATDDGVTTATLEVHLPKPSKIGGFILQEYIPLGQRVEGYAIECRVNGQWKEVFSGKTIGYKRIILEGHSTAPALAFNEGNIDVLKLKENGAEHGKVTFPVADAVRLKITSAKACPLINNFQIVGDIPETKWKAVAVPEIEGAGPASNAVDDNPNTLWHTHGSKGESGLPQSLVVDMLAVKTIRGFTYTPRQDGCLHGMVDRYDFAVSEDGKNWKKVSEGEFTGLRTDQRQRSVAFAPTKARFFRFTATHAVEKNVAAVAELGVIE
jgi:alpha-L-fucosidase